LLQALLFKVEQHGRVRVQGMMCVSHSVLCSPTQDSLSVLSGALQVPVPPWSLGGIQIQLIPLHVGQALFEHP